MILITGATGNNGAELTKRLAGSTARVRAMVRKHPEAADALPGIEYVFKFLYARKTVFHHSLPEIPGSARDGKPRSFLLCFGW